MKFPVLLISVLFIIISSAYAQHVDTVYFDNKWKSSDKSSFSSYRVIKTIDTNTYDVSYYSKDGIFQMGGVFIPTSPEVEEGVFTWCDINGKPLVQKFVHRNEFLKESVIWQKKGNATATSKVNRTPQFPGGLAGAIQYIYEYCKYPAELTFRPKGELELWVHIFNDGSIGDIKVIKPVHPLIDAEIVRVVSGMPNWIPALVNGKAINMLYKLRVPIN